MIRLSILITCLLFISSCSNNDVDPIDCSKTGLFISLGTVVNATSCGTNDGSIAISASGGKEPYTYLANEISGPTSGQFINMPAGIYTMKVRDANGCTATIENVSVRATDFSFTADVQQNTLCISGNGAVTIQVTDGSPPYLFKFGTGAFLEQNTFGGLRQGVYTIAVKDSNECTIDLHVSIPRGATGTSWNNDVKPIMTTYCALSGCHNGSARTDLRVFSNAKQAAATIKTRTQSRNMPQEGTLTQQQIDIIACWVDDGALEN